MIFRSLCLTAVILLITTASYGEVNPSYELSMAKGVQRFNDGDYDSSALFFEEALRSIPGDSRASIFLGVARIIQGRYSEAEDLLKSAIPAGKDLPRIYYELGYIEYKKGNYSESRVYLNKSREISPDINLNESIDALMASMEFGHYKKKFYLTGMLGLQYDSNVAFISETATTAEKKADTRGVFYGSALWIPVDSNVRTALGYNFYQSLHSSLSDFDQQTHELFAVAGFDLSRKISVNGKYSYEYTYLGGDPYGRTHLLSPFILINWDRGLNTRLFYEYRDKTYWDTDVSTDSFNRSGSNNLAGIEQEFPLYKNLGTKILYSSERNSANADYWTYDGNRIAGELYYFYERFRLDLTAEYYDKQYKGIFPGTSTERHDKIETYSASVSGFISKNFSLNLSQVFVHNGSNLSFFDYNRSISGLFFIASF